MVSRSVLPYWLLLGVSVGGTQPTCLNLINYFLVAAPSWAGRGRGGWGILVGDGCGPLAVVRREGCTVRGGVRWGRDAMGGICKVGDQGCAYHSADSAPAGPYDAAAGYHRAGMLTVDAIAHP